MGRTGTFIVLDVILDQMNAEGTIDIKGTVQKMREKRMFMVQTLVRIHAVPNLCALIELLAYTIYIICFCIVC